MIKRLKNLLGIEGVKLRIDLIQVPKNDLVKGQIVMFAPSDFVVTELTFILEEVYTRGRFNRKKQDTYVLKSWKDRVNLPVQGDTPTEVPFEFTYTPIESPIDKWGKSSWPLKMASGLIKGVHGVNSEIFLTIKAKVKGIALHPYDRVLVH